MLKNNFALPAPPAFAGLLQGLGNEALVTVLVLYVVVAGLSRTGAMNLVTRPLLGRPRSVSSARAWSPCPLPRARRRSPR